MSTSRKNHNLVLIIGFLILISLPFVAGIFEFREGNSILENRRVERMPVLEIDDASNNSDITLRTKKIYLAIVKFIRKFDNYHSTTFSFRSDLLGLYNIIKIDILATDPLPQKVVQGKDGWYFLGDSYSNVIKESKGIQNFSHANLSVLLTKIVEHKTWLKKRNIEFYVAGAPNKLSVYGDFLPIEKSTKKTTTEQMDSACLNSFNFIDLKHNFSNTSRARLYYKTDSHWNDYGAFWGYISLVEKIKTKYPKVPILRQADFTIDTMLSYQQDLTRMLALKIKEEVILLKPKNPVHAVLQVRQLNVPKNYPRPAADYEERYLSNANNLKVLVLHDSFGTHLKKFIKESFGETVFIWDTRFNKDLIEVEKPDIVIQIIAERHLELLGR